MSRKVNAGKYLKLKDKCVFNWCEDALYYPDTAIEALEDFQRAIDALYSLDVGARTGLPWTDKMDKRWNMDYSTYAYETLEPIRDAFISQLLNVKRLIEILKEEAEQVCDTEREEV